MIPDLNNKLSILGFALPKISDTVGAYEAVTLANRFVYISGQLAFKEDGTLITGFVGRDISIEEGVVAAERCALGIIAQISKNMNDKKLDFDGMVSLQGYISCDADFTKHSIVINGCSNLLLKTLGELGKHSRIAVGVSSLPLGSAVEISAIAKVK